MYEDYGIVDKTLFVSNR